MAAEGSTSKWRLPSRTPHFHCYGCGKEGVEGLLVRGLLQPVQPVNYLMLDAASEHWDGKCPF